MAALWIHHMVPKDAIKILRDFYITKTGGSSAAANAWAKGIIEAPINEIPLPTSASDALALNVPNHPGGPLNSYQTNALQRVEAIVQVNRPEFAGGSLS